MVTLYGEGNRRVTGNIRNNRRNYEYFIPKTNVSVERHKFNSRMQLSRETFDMFLSELRKIAANCNFGNLKDKLIRDRIVCAVNDKRVKDRLLRESDLTLKKAIDICQAAELTNSNISELLHKNQIGDVAAINKKSTSDFEARGHKQWRDGSGVSNWNRGNKKCTATSSTPAYQHSYYSQNS
ncbi:hypothetical protein TcasGA2_TC002046 [Tribolium castaneum]|uniref:Uncharacterized protein n=1 Tax=Tribolium castaneum TaxID=7070 RepID=D7ELL3_TRICA|nr:hypothetical protein TcasGA2_TC002046 [Tribolium castaneum]